MEKTLTRETVQAGRFYHHAAFGRVYVTRRFATTCTVTRWGKGMLDEGKQITERGVAYARLSEIVK